MTEFYAHEFEAPSMASLGEGLEVTEGAVGLVDVLVVADVVAHVDLRTRERAGKDKRI